MAILALPLTLAVLTVQPLPVPPPDTALYAAVCRVYGALDGAKIWPGYRPDTIPVAYVVPGTGTVLCGWRGTLPEGFTPLGSNLAWAAVVDRAAANTNTQLANRGVAQIATGENPTAAGLLFLSAHEAFHVFERSARRPGAGHRFGSGENTFLMTRYPVFEQDNEAGFALEAKVLAAALAARRDSDARAGAWQFLALREERQRTLGGDLAEFEVMTEINEGPAEYAGLRAVEIAQLPAAWRDAAARTARDVRDRLDSVTTQSRNSLRLRFYATGPALAKLLDRLDGEEWKHDLMAHDRTLQEELAVVSGYADRGTRLRQQARARFVWPALTRQAAGAIAGLQATRRAQVDSALAAPGTLVVIEAAAIGGVGMCGMDPQNMLQAGPGLLLHRRWVRLCAGAALQSEFTTPVVQDDSANTIRAVLGDSIQWTAAGQALAVPDGARLAGLTNLELHTAAADLKAAHASVARAGRVVTITLQR